MRMYALAARSGYFQRAMEVGVHLTPHYKQLAISYASQLQLKSLCLRMDSLLSADNEALANPRANPASTSLAEMDADCVLEGLDEDNDCNLSLLPEEEIGHLLSGAKAGREAATNIFSTAPTNPFRQKESSTAAARASSIDKNFIKSVIQKSMGGKPTGAASLLPPPSAPVPASRQSTLTGEGRARAVTTGEGEEQTQTDSSEKRAIGFREWLEQTLPLLEAENPQLKRSDLIKMATQRWREERKETA